jgi:hypothetical protein
MISSPDGMVSLPLGGGDSMRNWVSFPLAIDWFILRSYAIVFQFENPAKGVTET